MLVDRMPSAEYFALDRASKSGLDKIAKSPLHYQARGSSRPTPQMQIGTALHALVLEGIKPTVRPSFRGTGSVAARAEWNAAHEGALIIDADDAGDVYGMRDSLMAHPTIGAALRRPEGRSEVSALWQCPDTGTDCKSRFDWLLPSAILDLKTCADASPTAFARSVANYRYFVQDAFYSQAAATEGLDVDYFLFACVESSRPYACAVYQLDDAARLEGRRLYLRDLATLARCKAANEWPGYPTEIQTLSLPRWAFQGNDYE